MIKHFKYNNFNLNILKTTKFKTTRLEISFANDLTIEDSTKRALIPYLLKSITKQYDSRSKLHIHLEEMYGASFGAGVKKVGLTQIIVFDLGIINNKYTLNKEDLFVDGINFLKEIIFNPLFSEEVFKEETRLLSEYFQGIYANKMRYSIKQTFKEMYKDDPFGVDAFGYIEALETLTLNDCIEAYNRMLLEDVININVVGDVEFDEVDSIIKKVLNFPDRNKELVLIDDSEKPIRDPRVIKESQNVNQGKMVLGYQFPVYYQTEDYYKAIVMNTLIGGGPESLLFKRIREELSLVYFIGSVYDHYKGSFLIYAGINQFEHENVVKEINTTLEEVKNENYTDKALVIAKKAIISSLIQSLDSSSSLIVRINNLSLFDKEFDQETLIQKINQVTKKDISNLLSNLTEDVNYLLRNDTLENN